jgi:NADH-quinone oxidoreductase subunit J
MTIKDIFIYLLGFLSVLSALGVVLSRKSLNSALCLVATMVLIAGQFAMMRADFIATIQILVYGGAIMILVVFVIMLLGVERDAEKVRYPLPAYAGFVFSVLFVAIVYSLISGFDSSAIMYPPVSESGIAGVDQDRSGEVYQVGRYLLEDHIVAFQATGVLLLAAILGAALLSYPKERPLLPGRGLRAVREKFNAGRSAASDTE